MSPPVFNMVAKLSFDIRSIGTGKVFLDILQLILQRLLLITHLPDQDFIVITLTLQLLELLLKRSVVVVQVLVHLFVFVQLGLVLADGVLQADFALVGLVAVVLQLLLHVADLGLLVGQFVLEVLLGLEQVVIVVLKALDSCVHVVHGELVLLLQVVEVGLESLLVACQVHQIVIEGLVVSDENLGLLPQSLALVF